MFSVELSSCSLTNFKKNILGERALLIKRLNEQYIYHHYSSLGITVRSVQADNIIAGNLSKSPGQTKSSHALQNSNVEIPELPSSPTNP